MRLAAQIWPLVFVAVIAFGDVALARDRRGKRRGRRGDRCHVAHWHGFPGVEKQADDEIVAWAADPKT